jgi:hypothetical protein
MVTQWKWELRSHQNSGESAMRSRDRENVITIPPSSEATGRAGEEGSSGKPTGDQRSPVSARLAQMRVEQKSSWNAG